MSETTEPTKRSGAAIPLIVIGLALMAGGGWLAMNPPEGLKGFYESLEHQGIALDFGKTISAIGVFMVLFQVIKGFFFNPLDEAIHNRTSELESTFSEAETLRSEIKTMRSEYETRIVKTELDAREQIQAQLKEAQALAQQLKTEAAAQAEEMKRAASADIANERDKVMRELQINVVNLTLQATEKLLGENVDSEKNRKLVEEFITKVEAPI